MLWWKQMTTRSVIWSKREFFFLNVKLVFDDRKEKKALLQMKSWLHQSGCARRRRRWEEGWWCECLTDETSDSLSAHTHAHTLTDTKSRGFLWLVIVQNIHGMSTRSSAALKWTVLPARPGTVVFIYFKLSVFYVVWIIRHKLLLTRSVFWQFVMLKESTY